MSRFIIFLCFFGINFQLIAQSSDIITVSRKNGKYLKSFFTGSAISFQTKNNNYVDGVIQSIKHDSLFIKTSVMGRYMTKFGFTVIDTSYSFTSGFSFKDIAHIKLDAKKSFLRKNLGGLLIAGGLGYAVLNVINRTINNEPIGSKGNIKSLGTAGAAIALGVFVHKIFPVVKYTRKTDKITYVNMQVSK